MWLKVWLKVTIIYFVGNKEINWRSKRPFWCLNLQNHNLSTGGNFMSPLTSFLELGSLIRTKTNCSNSKQTWVKTIWIPWLVMYTRESSFWVVPKLHIFAGKPPTQAITNGWGPPLGLKWLATLNNQFRGPPLPTRSMTNGCLHVSRGSGALLRRCWRQEHLMHF